MLEPIRERETQGYSSSSGNPTNPTGDRRAEVLLSGDDGGEDENHGHRVTMVQSIDEDVVIDRRMVFASVQLRGKAENIHGDSSIEINRKRKKTRRIDEEFLLSSKDRLNTTMIFHVMFLIIKRRVNAMLVEGNEDVPFEFFFVLKREGEREGENFRG